MQWHRDAGLPRHPVQRGRRDQHRGRAALAVARLRHRRHRARGLPLTRARVCRAARDVPAAGLSPFRETGRGTSPGHGGIPFVNLGDVPRLVWVLAAGRFVGSASSFLMLFLILYLTGPRDLPVARPAWSRAATASGCCSATSPAAGGVTGRPPPHLLPAPPSPAWASPRCRGCRCPRWRSRCRSFAYLGATAGGLQGALAALAVGRAATGVRRSRSAGPPPTPASSSAPRSGRSSSATATTRSSSSTALLTLARAVSPVAPCLPRRRARASRAGSDAPGLWRALRADRASDDPAAGVVLVDLVYRQLYTTLPIYLRDAGQPVALYTALIAVGSGLILALEIPVALRLRRLPVVPDHRDRLRPGRRRLRAVRRCRSPRPRRRCWRWWC